MCSKAHALTLPEQVIKEAKSLSSIREKTINNDHPEIDRMLADLGLPKGLSWCLAFCIRCYKKACDFLGMINPLPKIARCSRFYSLAKGDPSRFLVISRERAAWGVYELKPADVSIWSHNRTANNNNWNGHAGIVISPVKEGRFKTIEGNTTPGPEGNQREGGGVYVRERSLAPGVFQIEGFVRPLL